jgi:hypothetical protein
LHGNAFQITDDGILEQLWVGQEDIEPVLHSEGKLAGGNNWLEHACRFVRNDTENYINNYVRFEIYTGVTVKNGVFWDFTPCGPCKNQSFGGN